MTNLLPLEEKQRLLSKKKERLFIVFGIVALISLICLILVLLSIKFYILSSTDYQKNMLVQVKKEAQIKDSIDFNSTIKKYNKTLGQLASFYDQEIYFNQVLNTISNIPSPEDLYFNNFSLVRIERGAVRITLSGVSGTRENLLLFQKNIEGSEKIKNVVFSPQSWIKPKNTNFSLTFEISNNKK